MIELLAPSRCTADGHKIYLYGTSSYGYDVLFARTRSSPTSIDHRRSEEFHEKSFVDITADVCIIPPNLLHWRARWSTFDSTLTLVVCLGKSTYARCGNSERNAFGTRGKGTSRSSFPTPRRCGEDLRQRRRGTDVVLRIGRGLLDPRARARWRKGAAGPTRRGLPPKAPMVADLSMSSEHHSVPRICTLTGR